MSVNGATVVSIKSSESIKSRPAFIKSKKLFSEVLLTGVGSVTGIVTVAFLASGLGSSGSGPKRIEKKSNDSSSSSILRPKFFCSPCSEIKMVVTSLFRTHQNPKHLLQSYRTAQHSPRGTLGVQPLIAGAHFFGVHLAAPRMQKHTWHGSGEPIRSPSG